MARTRWSCSRRQGYTKCRMSNDECLKKSEIRMSKLLRIASNFSTALLSATAFVGRLLGDDLVHEDVMRLRGDFGEELAFECQGDERRVGTGVFEELVVVALAVTHPRPVARESDAGNHDKIELGHRHLPVSQVPQFELRLENFVHADGEVRS